MKPLLATARLASATPLSAARGVSFNGFDTYALALLAGASVGVLAYVSLQATCALVLAATVLLLYLHNRALGLVGMWLLWLTIPMVRRLFALIEGTPGADPLSLAPFAAVGAIALVEINRTSLDRRVKVVLGMSIAGLLLGVPSGASEPQAMLFALCAYASAAGALVIGYSERPRSIRDVSLFRAFLLFGAPLALYGIAQYFLPLPHWDEVWRTTVAADYGSIGSPEEDKVRVWSALNGPGTLAAVLALGSLLLLSASRLRHAESVTLALATVCLALTFVRSAWVALVVGVIAYGLAARGRGGRRAACFLAILAIGVVGLSGTGSTGAAFNERVLTIGTPSEDTSAQARTATATTLAPEAATRPFGEGLGSAGEAAKLRGPGGLSDPDNGYLSILYQTGPVGLLLFVGAMVIGLASSITVLRRGRAPTLATAGFAAIVFFATMELFGDALYGVTGAAFWYLVGVVLRLRAQPHRRSPAPLSERRSDGTPVPIPSNPNPQGAFS